VAALAHYAKQDLEGARAKLETCLEKDPTNGDAAIFLGQLNYMKAGELKAAEDPGAAAAFAKAAETFEMAYRADPSNAETIANLIDSYEQAGQSDKALALTRDAVERDPENKVFRYAYGVFMVKQGDFEGAVGQFQKAVEIDPDYDDAIYNLGVAYLNWGVKEKGEIDKRAEEAQKAGKKIPEDRSYQERFKQALPWLELAAQKRPDDGLLWQQLGRVYANLNMVDKSKAAFDRFDAISKEK
jgi:tetratricopeptide (TPR) repeat protein